MNKSKMARRELDLRSADEVIAEIESLRDSGYQRLGNWNLTQICEHLRATMKGGMNGFGFRLPWILRATVFKWVLSRAMKTRKMGAGAPTFKTLKPTDPGEEEDDSVLVECMETCRTANSFNGSLDQYPLLNDLTPDDWRELMWIHASHHLGFLVPNQTS